VGLVAITPAAGYVSVGASLLIGTTAAIACHVAAHWRSRSSIDDTLDVFACHGVGGAVGTIATGIFAQDVGLAFGHSGLFFTHLLALGVVILWAFGGSWLLYRLTNAMIPLRVSAEDEAIGLDLSQHGEALARVSAPDTTLAA
jgi:Amt family ammonium transporter